MHKVEEGALILLSFLEKMKIWLYYMLNYRTCSGSALSRVTILAEWLRYFNDLAVGETAAPACFLRENAEGEGMPPLLSH